MKPGMTWLQEAALRKPVAVIGDCAILEPRLHICDPDAKVRVRVVGETRQAKWKRLHPEKVREAQKLLMRKRRAKV